MDPHQRTRRFPIIDAVALGKPGGRATMMRFAGDIVIYPWIWGRQPTAKLLLAPVTYEVVSAYMPRSDYINGLRTFQLIHFDSQFLHQD
jgi:hypothetical protein